MSDDWGDTILFQVHGGSVFITFLTSGGEDIAQMKLGGAGQEEFAQLYVAACHQAKADSAQAATR